MMNAFLLSSLFSSSRECRFFLLPLPIYWAKLRLRMEVMLGKQTSKKKAGVGGITSFVFLGTEKSDPDHSKAEGR